MRMALKDKIDMQYALYEGKRETYETDADGNAVFEEVDGEEVPVPKGVSLIYGDPVPFRGCVSFAWGAGDDAREYGVSWNDYDGKLVTLKDELPIDETSLIFMDSAPQYDGDGLLVRESADFRVLRKTQTLNQSVYLLKRMAHGAEG